MEKTGTEIREQEERRLRREAEMKTGLRRILAWGASVEEGSDDARLLEAGRRWAQGVARRVEERDGSDLPGADDLTLVRELLWERIDDEEWAGFFSDLPARIRQARKNEAEVDASCRVGSGMVTAYLRGELTLGGDFVTERVLRRYMALRDAEHAPVDDFLAFDYMRDLDLIDDDDAHEMERIVFSGPRPPWGRRPRPQGLFGCRHRERGWTVRTKG